MSLDKQLKESMAYRFEVSSKRPCGGRLEKEIKPIRERWNKTVRAEDFDRSGIIEKCEPEGVCKTLKKEKALKVF